MLKQRGRPSADHRNCLLHFLVLSLVVSKNRSLRISDWLGIGPNYLIGFLQAAAILRRNIAVLFYNGTVFSKSCQRNIWSMFFYSSEQIFFLPRCFYQTMFKNIFVWLIYYSWKEDGVRLQDALIRKAAPIPTGSKRRLSYSARLSVFRQLGSFFLSNVLPGKWHRLFPMLIWIPRPALASYYLLLSFSMESECNLCLRSRGQSVNTACCFSHNMLFKGYVGGSFCRTQ